MSIRGEQVIVLDCQGIGELGRSRTKQAMKDESDINNIVNRFAKTGMLTHVSTKSPTYLDVSAVTDYRDAIEQVRKTEVFFGGLPAKVRAHFSNDAAAFLDFMTDPSREAEARELGLIPEPEKAPEVVPRGPVVS